MSTSRIVLFAAFILQLSVLVAAGELLCSVSKTQSDGRIGHGSFVRFSCRWSEPGANDTDLDWYRIDPDGNNTELSSENGLATWRVAGLDNGVEFHCVGRRSSLNATASVEDSACSTVALMEYPTVTVGSFLEKFVLGKEASYTCHAEGLPEIAGYRWFVDGVEDGGSDGRFTRLAGGRTLTIANFVRSDNGSVVMCEAYVPSGLTANASLTIDLVLPEADGSNLWIFIACAAAGGIPVVVLSLVCLVCCLRKTHQVTGSRSKKRSQSRRHIVLNEEVNEPRATPATPNAETPVAAQAETCLNERSDNGPMPLPDDDDGTNPPPYKPAPPPVQDHEFSALYVNTPGPSFAASATLPNRPLSPNHYIAPKPTHQRKKTEYENIAHDHDQENGQDLSRQDDDVYENVAPARPLSPKPLVHTASLPNFSSSRI